MYLVEVVKINTILTEEILEKRKMKQWILLIFSISSILLVQKINAQDCIGDLIFFNQSAIDSFPITHPNCNIIYGNVLIQDDADPITNLDSLKNVNHIYGDLKITFNENLQSLSGLNQLISVQGNVEIGSNGILESLSALSSLVFIEKGFYLYRNPLLEEISCFGLNTIGDNIEIYQNNSLINLSGLEGLTSIQGNLILFSNGITDLQGLENIEEIKGNFKITELSNLESIEALSSLTDVHGDFLLSNLVSLTSLNGLNNLQTVSKNLSISNCNLLENCEPLESLIAVEKDFIITNHPLMSTIGSLQQLSKVGSLFLGRLEIVTMGDFPSLVAIENKVKISNCNLLEDLSGFEAVHEIGFLELLLNESLISLDGLDNLHQADTLIFRYLPVNNLKPLEQLQKVRILRISRCTQLESLHGLTSLDPYYLLSVYLDYNTGLHHCHIESICNYLQIPNKFFRGSENQDNCNEKETVRSLCTSKIKGNDFPQDDITIFPNPTKNRITIKSGTNFLKTQVIDQLGKVLIDDAFLPKQKKVIHLDFVPVGLYRIIIYNSKGLKSSKKILLIN